MLVPAASAGTSPCVLNETACVAPPIVDDCFVSHGDNGFWHWTPEWNPLNYQWWAHENPAQMNGGCMSDAPVAGEHVSDIPGLVGSLPEASDVADALPDVQADLGDVDESVPSDLSALEDYWFIVEALP